MPFTSSDEQILQGCLDRQPGAWIAFVDRYASVVARVVDQAAHACDVALGGDDRDELREKVLRKLVENDFELLRSFRRQCSLASYLAVVAQRIAVGLLVEHESDVLTVCTYVAHGQRTFAFGPSPPVEKRDSRKATVWLDWQPAR